MAAKINSLERAIRELGQWQSQVESRKFAADDLSEPAAVGVPDAASHAVAGAGPSFLRRIEDGDGCASNVQITQANLGETAKVALAAQSPLPPATPLAVPRPVITPVLDKSPAEAKPKASEIESSSHPHTGLVVEAIGLDPSVWNCAWIDGANASSLFFWGRDASLLIGLEGIGRLCSAWAVMVRLTPTFIQCHFIHSVQFCPLGLLPLRPSLKKKTHFQNGGSVPTSHLCPFLNILQSCAHASLLPIHLSICLSCSSDDISTIYDTSTTHQLSVHLSAHSTLYACPSCMHTNPPTHPPPSGDGLYTSLIESSAGLAPEPRCTGPLHLANNPHAKVA